MTSFSDTTTTGVRVVCVWRGGGLNYHTTRARRRCAATTPGGGGQCPRGIRPAWDSGRNGEPSGCRPLTHGRWPASSREGGRRGEEEEDGAVEEGTSSS